MPNIKTAVALAIAATITLTGCSTSEPNTSAGPWKATEFPAAAMSSSDAVIPAGTYDFTFSSSAPLENGNADTVSASGRITLGNDKCVLNAQAKVITGGVTTDYQIVKPADKGVHVYDSASQQWVTDPTSIAFMPMMSFAGAGISPRADLYSSFCVLNGIALIAEQSKEVGQEGTYNVNAAVLAEYIQANADWYIDKILTALSYAGDTRETAVPLLKKHFGLDKVDTTLGKDEVFTLARGADGSITLFGARGPEGSNYDRGTFVLTPTKEPIDTTIPKGKVPVIWTQLIANGVEMAGSMSNYLSGTFPSQSPIPVEEKKEDSAK